MNHKSLLSVLVLSGALVFEFAPAWSQQERMEKKGPEYPGGIQPGTKTPDEPMPPSEPTGSPTGKTGDSDLGPGSDPGMQPGDKTPSREKTIREPAGRGTKGARSAMGSRGEWATEDIQKVQEALKDKGHDPGAIDGVLGPKTQKAIQSFQRASGLRATGRIDAETAKQLGVEVK